MRRAQLARPAEEGLSVLDVAPFAHLAWVDGSGEAQIRSVHALRFEDEVIFHGAKASALAKSPGQKVVLQAEQVLAAIPSYFLDPERACPATTFYRSVQVEGTLESCVLGEAKAAALAALMDRFQPEGGYVPLSAEAEIYRGAVKGVAVTRLVPGRVTARSNLAQSKSVEVKRQLIDALWNRGTDGDLETIERIRMVSEEDPAPPSWCGDPISLHPWAPPADADRFSAPLAETYWNEGISPEAIAAAHRASAAWVVARDGAGGIVASARALSDDTKHAWIYDVWVEPGLRRRGVATRLMTMLLAHPRVRGVGRVHLQTRDAQPLYRKLAFEERPLGHFSHMELERG